jgi:thiamine biosynthesis lipoprotein
MSAATSSALPLRPLPPPRRRARLRSPLLGLGLRLLAVLGMAATADAADEPQRCEFVSRQMGTLFQIVVYAPDAATAQPAVAAAWARVAELNRLFSDYDPHSEVSRLGRAPVGTAVEVSADLFAVLAQSQRLAADSDGAFDVTLGPAVRLWREARRTRQLPSATARAAARQAAGHTQLGLDATMRTVTLLAAGMQLDLGGIAKGYAADAALAVLARHGFRRAMVAASGDLALGDAPPGASGWKIEIAPFGQADAAPLVLNLANAAVSTSGDAEQGLDFAGVRYSHILDPVTGLGLTVPVAVTVVARHATTSDALATALSVLAARAPDRIPACLGPTAHAMVFRRGPDGRVHRDSYGTPPAGLFTSL